MIIKIGNKLFDSNHEPIMLILSKEEQKLIGSMGYECNKFCSYPDGYDQNEIEKFMDITEEDEVEHGRFEKEEV